MSTPRFENPRSETPRSEPPSTHDIDHRLNLTIARVLAFGLAVASALMIGGALVALAGRDVVAPRASALAELPGALSAARPTALLSLGLLVLIGTPAARVLVLLGAFVRRREWGYALVSAAVLAVLGVGLALGLVG